MSCPARATGGGRTDKLKAGLFTRKRQVAFAFMGLDDNAKTNIVWVPRLTKKIADSRLAFGVSVGRDADEDHGAVCIVGIAYSQDILYILGVADDTPRLIKKLITIAPELADAIVIYRHNNRFKTEMDAIRRLLEAGLRAEAERHRKSSEKE
jgi:hypothetical protein